MKIEKVNEHQIRCTLTKEDLASRKIKLSELAYGTTKAKALFKDMMEMASDEYGFEADNIPLMIEAIPVNPECIVLIITKVEEPEELDTRFSKFSDSATSDDDDDDNFLNPDTGSNFTPISDLFKKFKESVKEQQVSNNGNGNILKPVPTYNAKAFSFSEITELAKICKVAYSFYTGSSSVFRDLDSNDYLLVLSRDNMEIQDFVQACNLFGEYSNISKNKLITEGYLMEHFETVCDKNAIEILKDLA